MIHELSGMLNQLIYNKWSYLNCENINKTKLLPKRKYFWIKSERKRTIYSTKKNPFGLVSLESIKAKDVLYEQSYHDFQKRRFLPWNSCNPHTISSTRSNSPFCGD